MLPLVTVMYMLFASTFTFGKAALTFVDPLLFIGLRMSGAGILLLTYRWFAHHKKEVWNRSDLILFSQIVLFHIYFPYALEFWSLQYVSSAKACLLFNLSPFITGLLAYFLLAERLTHKQWIGVCIGILGFLPILATYDDFSIGGQFMSLPELLLIGSVASACYGWILFKKLMNRGHNPIAINGIGMLGGGIISLISSCIIEGYPSIKGVEIAGFGWSLGMLIAYVLVLILIGNIICYNLYGYLLKQYSPTFLSFAGFMTPLFGALFGWFFRSEVITWHFGASVSIIFVGLWLFYQDELHRGIRTH